MESEVSLLLSKEATSSPCHVKVMSLCTPCKTCGAVEVYIQGFLTLILPRSCMGTVWFRTSTKHRLRCGHLNTRRTKHAETWNHSLTRYFHIT